MQGDKTYNIIQLQWRPYVGVMFRAYSLHGHMICHTIIIHNITGQRLTTMRGARWKLKPGNGRTVYIYHVPVRVQ